MPEDSSARSGLGLGQLARHPFRLLLADVPRSVDAQLTRLEPMRKTAEDDRLPARGTGALGSAVGLILRRGEEFLCRVGALRWHVHRVLIRLLLMFFGATCIMVGGPGRGCGQ